jgi:outer membrane protein TolC
MFQIDLLLSCWRRGRVFGAALLLLGSAGLSAQPNGVAGTLPEDYVPGLKPILAGALKQSPAMLLQNIALAQAEAGRYLSDSILWPSMAGSAGYSKGGSRSASTGTDSTFTSQSGGNYNVGFNQALFQWGANKARADIGRLAEQVTQRQYADAYRGLVGSLRTQYLGLISKKIMLRNSRYLLKLQEESLAAQEDQLKNGVLSEGDIISPRLSFQEATLNFERQVQDFDYTKRLFLRTAGLEQLADDSIPEDLNRPIYSSAVAQSLLDTFLRGGVRDTLQGQIYVLTLKQNELNYKIAKVGLLFPKFSFGANYGQQTTFVPQANGSVVTSTQISYSLGLSGYVPIFDGFATRGAKRSALATKRSTEQQLSSYIDATADTAQNMRRQLDFLARALDLAESRRALAQDQVRKMTQQVEEGSISKSALETVTGAFNYADLVAIGARTDYLNRWSDYVLLIDADPICNQLPVRYLTLSHGK